MLIISNLCIDCNPKTGTTLNRIANIWHKAAAHQKQPSQESIMKMPIYKGFLPVIRKLFTITCVFKTQKNTSQFTFSQREKSFIFKWRGAWLLWPDGMTHLQWQKTLRRVCWFLFCKKKKTSLNGQRNQKVKRRVEKLLKDLLESRKQEKIHRTEKVQKTNALNKLPQQLKTPLNQNNLDTAAKELCCKKEQSKDVRIELITLLKKFLNRRNIPGMIEKTITDCRDPEAIIYSVPTILLAALSIFLLRMQSGNKYDDKTNDPDEKYSKKNISKFINAPEDLTPAIKKIEDFLKTIKLEQINSLMIQFFKDLIKSKFFSDHPEITLGDYFLVAVDCVHSHTYSKPHHLDEDKQADCPYCLKRVYNKGTLQEKTKWLHNTLVYTFVFLNHLKIPFYTYPIHAKQVKKFETASDSDHKQECELVALKETLPLIRQFFSRMKICLLLDGLYANRPTIQLAEQYECKYAIVRKDGCLSSLAKDCNGLAQMLEHQKDHTKQTVLVEKEWQITRKYEWFNNMDLGVDKGKPIITHVLRFSENREKTNRKTGKKEIQSYKGEWLFSEKLSSRNCELAARKARLRWEEEDLFNSQKNREFNYKHDYSRDPRSMFIWQALSFFAFGIFELFRFSEPVMQRILVSTESKTTISRIALVEKLSAQLCERPTEEIFSIECMSKKIQFRYDFSPPKTKPKSKVKKSGKDRLKAA